MLWYAVYLRLVQFSGAKKSAPKDAKRFTSYQRSKELLKVNLHLPFNQRIANGYSTITRTSSRSDSNAVARVFA